MPRFSMHHLLCGVAVFSMFVAGDHARAASPLPASPDADRMEEGFRAPPASARPRVWWHWMNGNITKEGIAADLAWMKRVGIGGVQNFDIDLDTQQIVDQRLVYMTPPWKDAFRFAASEAERLGLELAIASSPGWSETGGPWVAPEDGLKKLVWSETLVQGGRRQTIRLKQPPSVAGPFQDLGSQVEVTELISGAAPKAGPAFYRDVKVLAVPVQLAEPLPAPQLTDGEGKALVAAKDQRGALVANVQLGPVIAKKAPELRLDFGRPVTVRTVTLHIPGGAIPLIGPLLAPVLQSSADGKTWSDIATVPLEATPSTLALNPVTARYFRLVIKPAHAAANGNPAPDEHTGDLAMGDVFGKGMGRLISAPVTIGLLDFGVETKIDRYEVKAGFSIAPDYYALPGVKDGATGPAADRTLDLTDRMKPDGTLDWTPPPGTWKVLRFGSSLVGKTNHPAPAEATGLEVDKYDAGAVRRYLEHYLANYRDAAGEGMMGAQGVRALLNDSIEIGAANWTPRMIERFKSLRGYDPVPWMPTLAGTLMGTREESERFLFDYRRTLSDLMASEHYGTIADVAHHHGLKVYGEAIEGNRSSFGDDMAMRRFADYPMAAMWAFPAKQGPAPSYVIDVRGAASVGHLYGQNIIAAESMTAGMAPWAFGPSDLKHIADQEFVLGVNRPVVHTSVHVPVEDRKPGLSLGGIGQFFNRNESWAELAKPWVDYLSRNAFMLQQGRNWADVAYFYGEEAPLSGLYGTRPVADAPSRYAYDFVNVDALTSALTNDGDGLVSPGGARYRVLYLGGSSRRMTLPTLRRIAELVEGGATVIGMAPESSPGLMNDRAEYDALVRKLWPASGGTGAAVRVGKGQVIASAYIDGALADLGIAPDFLAVGASDKADIAFAHRHFADGESYFLVNRTGRTERFEAHFAVSGKAPQLWHAETGAIEEASYRIAGNETIVPMELKAGDAVHVVFRRPAESGGRRTAPATGGAVATLTGRWEVRFEAGRGAPVQIDMAALAPLDQNADPRVRYFSGIATYSTSFAPPKGWRPGQPLSLDLGEAREIAEVTVNGKAAGAVWRAPYTVEVGAFTRPGKANRLEIRVANLWVNRLIADADPAVKDKVSWTSVRTYKPTAALRRSGLIGPVTLQTGR
ncbi:hypothetical protein FHW96_001976 [Novosphingobium sp. SG751A]|uniref:glycosyl hydrolase n=1 Tax=Novosphingobium sp. SG751A TaxID=2587000 RepID=UPI001557EAC9|nr:glycosyl hydrolase [Novosphingobium sp. SG751A]NOW45818.1 hypothetical protein [Novosphingobium sp. SG751A]